MSDAQQRIVDQLRSARGGGAAYRAGGRAHRVELAGGAQVVSVTDVVGVRVRRRRPASSAVRWLARLRQLVGRPLVGQLVATIRLGDGAREGADAVELVADASAERLAGLPWQTGRGESNVALDDTLALLAAIAAGGRPFDGLDAEGSSRTSPADQEASAAPRMEATTLRLIGGCWAGTLLVLCVAVALRSLGAALCIAVAAAVGLLPIATLARRRNLASGSTWKALPAFAMANLYTVALVAPVFLLARRAGARWRASRKYPTRTLMVASVFSLATSCCFGYVAVGYGLILVAWGETAQSTVLEVRGSRADGGEVTAWLHTASGRSLRIEQGISNSEHLPAVGETLELRYWPTQPKLNTKPNRSQAAMIVGLLLWIAPLLLDWLFLDMVRDRFGLRAVRFYTKRYQAMVILGRYLSAASFPLLWWLLAR